MIKTLTQKENQALKKFKSLVLKQFPKEVELIKLFGSKARGDYQEEKVAFKPICKKYL